LPPRAVLCPARARWREPGGDGKDALWGDAGQSSLYDGAGGAAPEFVARLVGAATLLASHILFRLPALPRKSRGRVKLASTIGAQNATRRALGPPPGGLRSAIAMVTLMSNTLRRLIAEFRRRLRYRPERSYMRGRADRA
jgi:hypothetical protein